MTVLKTPDFSNTEQAFAHKSDAELRAAIRLFGLFRYPLLVRWGPIVTVWALKLGLPVKALVKKWVFNHFCGGEDINQCDETAGLIYAKGVKSILDYSVEGVDDEKQFDINKEEILQMIRKASHSSYYPFAVFKTTGIIRFALLQDIQEKKVLSESERQEWERGKGRFRQVCEEAAALKVRLFIDAEESWIQDPIDQLTEQMMSIHNREQALIFNTLQMYRHDRLSYLQQAIQKAEEEGYYCGFKLVRGAYMEKERDRAAEQQYPSPIQVDKEATDRDFNAALNLCFEKREFLSTCAGTHNEESSLLLCKLIMDAGLPPSDERFWFAQLYGMSDHISFNLAASGFNVAKYLPYGPVISVMPYLSRRAEENTSVAGQMGRELEFLNKEWKRRKQSRI